MKTKKINKSNLFTMLMLVMALLIPQWGWAQTSSKPAEGDGSTNNPFLISSAEELVWFSNWVNGKDISSAAHGSACAKLMEDIDMNNINMDPIGNPSKYARTFYTGVFNGNRKSILNLQIIDQENSFVGLFGYSNGATIRNITFINAKVEGKQSYSTSGILAGETDNSTISGIKIINSNLKGNEYVGGIIGITNSSTVLNCESNATVSGEKNVGGIIGWISGSNSFKNILSLGNVTYTGVGGLLFGSFKSEALVHCIGAVVYDKDANLSSGTGDMKDSSNAAIGEGSLSSGTILGCSKDMLKSGFVTFILQQNSKTDDVLWGQNLSEEDGDEYPVLGSSYKVYANANIKLKCDGNYYDTGNYTNSEQEEEYELLMIHGSTTYKEGTPATCTQNGILNHYECNICHNAFEDQGLTQDLSDVTDYAKNHDYGTNDICIRCNKPIPEVKVGDNTIQIAMVSPALDKIAGYNLFKFTSTNGPSILSFTCNSNTCYSLWDSNKKLLENIFLTDRKLVYSIEANTTYYIGVKDVLSKAIDGNCTLTLQQVLKPEGLVGTGMRNNPFILKTGEHLKFFADYVNGTAPVTTTHYDACAKIADDVEKIDMSSICHAADNDNDTEVSWTPIGSSINNWHGEFEGNNKTISNLYINGNQSQIGLFGNVYMGHIKNLTFKSATVKNSAAETGILMGYACIATISNIVIDSKSSINGSECTGAIAGNANRTNFYNCINYAKVSGTNKVGGIAGFTENNTLSNVFAFGDVTATGGNSGGLIVGDLSNTTSNGVIAYNKEATLTINGTQVDAKATGSGSLSSTAYTKDEVKSGKLTYALNNGVTNGSQIWYQKLGENGDAYPMMKSTGENTVYGAYHHGDKERFFSNTVITNQHSVAYNAEAEDEANGNHDVSYEAGDYAWTDNDKTQAPTVAVTYTCKVCGKEATPQMTVEHDTEHNDVAATCTEEGHNYYKTSYTFNDKAVFSDAYTQTLPALGHNMLKEEVFFNEEKKIYMNYCQRNCDYYEYYITSDGSMKAMPYGEHENLFTLGSLSLDDATLYDTKARYDVWNFTYNRTFENDRWQALYVPFDLKCFQIAEDYEVATINNFHEYEQTDGSIKLVLEVKVTQKTIPALTPCVIRKKKAPETRTVESLVFEDVQFEPSANKTYDCASVARYYQFTGMLQAKDGFNVNQDFLMNGGMLYKAEADAQLSPQRWYLSATDRSGNSSVVEQLARVKSISINVVGEDDTTGIEDIYVTTDIEGVQSSRHGIYDLQGRKLSKEPSSGVYIKDGKKYVK